MEKFTIGRDNAPVIIGTRQRVVFWRIVERRPAFGRLFIVMERSKE
jgi:hypothetical protein